MALWTYEMEFPDGTRETRMLAAGNREAARERARKHAEGVGARLVSDVSVVDPVKGSM